MITRRGLPGTLLTAPVVIRTPGLLMPIKPVPRGYWTAVRVKAFQELRYSAIDRYPMVDAPFTYGKSIIQQIDEALQICCNKYMIPFAPRVYIISARAPAA